MAVVLVGAAPPHTSASSPSSATGSDKLVHCWASRRCRTWRHRAPRSSTTVQHSDSQHMQRVSTVTLAEYMYTATVGAQHGGSGFTAHELNCTAPLCEQPHCPELVQRQQTYFCCSQSSRGAEASCVTGSTCCRSVQFMYCEPSFIVITIPANTCSGYNNAHTNQPAGLMAFGLFANVLYNFARQLGHAGSKTLHQ